MEISKASQIMTASPRPRKSGRDKFNQWLIVLAGMPVIAASLVCVMSRSFRIRVRRRFDAKTYALAAGVK